MANNNSISLFKKMKLLLVKFCQNILPCPIIISNDERNIFRYVPGINLSQGFTTLGEGQHHHKQFKSNVRAGSQEQLQCGVILIQIRSKIPLQFNIWPWAYIQYTNKWRKFQKYCLHNIQCLLQSM